MKHLIIMMAFWVMITPYEYANGQYTKMKDGRDLYIDLDTVPYMVQGRNQNNGSEIIMLMMGTESLLFIEKEDVEKIKKYPNKNKFL